MTYDVIVVGAGPAGSAAAHACARQGLSTLCIEEHGTIGYPVQCAGLLSNAALAECGVSDRCVQNTVQGARVISGRGSSILLDAKKKKASVVDRGRLDREMAEAAAGAGAQYLVKTSVYGIRDGQVLTRGAYGHQQHGFKILVAADGPRSTIARCYGMQRAPVFLSGIQADMVLDRDPRFVEIYPDASPDFFGWTIPTGEGRVRVGLCGKEQVQERFREFVHRMGGDSSVHVVTGTLPLGVMPVTYGRRTLFVGDAAGFPKPTSGGGVYTGIRSARHAADIAVLACELDRYDDALLSGYEERWQADIGRELSLGFRLFRMRQDLTSEDIDGMIKAFGNKDILDAIVQYGDMDRPGKLVGMLLKKPALLRWLSPLLASGIRSFFY